MRRFEVTESRFIIKGASATGVIGAENNPNRPESMHPAHRLGTARCIHRTGRIHLRATPWGRPRRPPSSRLLVIVVEVLDLVNQFLVISGRFDRVLLFSLIGSAFTKYLDVFADLVLVHVEVSSNPLQ